MGNGCCASSSPINCVEEIPRDSTTGVIDSDVSLPPAPLLRSSTAPLAFAHVQHRRKTVPGAFRSVMSRGEIALGEQVAEAPSCDDDENPMAVFAAATAEYQRTMEQRWSTTRRHTASPRPPSLGRSNSSSTTASSRARQPQRWSLPADPSRSPRSRITTFTPQQDATPHNGSQRTSTTTTLSSHSYNYSRTAESAAASPVNPGVERLFSALATEPRREVDTEPDLEGIPSFAETMRPLQNENVVLK